MVLRKKRKVSPITLMCEIAIMAAVGFVLDELSSALFRGIFVNGGSIGIAMVVVLLMCYRRGPLAGLGVGLIMGIFDLMTGPYMIAASPIKIFLQVGLDYVFSYPAVALGGIFKPAFDRAETKHEKGRYLVLATLVGMAAKFACHYLSGILFYADPSAFAWDLNSVNPYLYCAIYNAAFMIPCGVLSGVLILILLQKAPQLFLIKTALKPIEKRYLKGSEMAGIAIILGVLLVLFGVFFIGYIRSFYYGDYGEYGSEFSFDPDMMIGWVLALFMAVFSLLSLIAGAKGKYRPHSYLRCLAFFGVLVLIYALARYTRCQIKGKDASIYLSWLGGGMLLTLVPLQYMWLKD